MRAIKIIAAVAAVVGAETRVVTATGSAFAYFEARAPPTPTGRARRGVRDGGGAEMLSRVRVEGFGGATEGSSGRVEGEG